MFKSNESLKLFIESLLESNEISELNLKDLSNGELDPNDSPLKIAEFGSSLGKEAQKAGKNIYQVEIDGVHYFFIGSIPEIQKRFSDFILKSKS